MKIKLPCRRELNSEDCKGIKNRHQRRQVALKVRLGGPSCAQEAPSCAWSAAWDVQVRPKRLQFALRVRLGTPKCDLRRSELRLECDWKRPFWRFDAKQVLGLFPVARRSEAPAGNIWIDRRPTHTSGRVRASDEPKIS